MKGPRRKPNKQGKGRIVREQPRKDSDNKRVNFDNERESKFEKDWKQNISSKSNDPAWYARNAELMRSAASIPFSPVVGRKSPFTVTAAVPGVMCLTWSPAIPDADRSAVNQAANSIYSYTVHANSRNQSYDAPDEMLLILAGAQVFSAIALGLRAFGTMRKFYQEDAYTPEALIKAMGFDYTDLQSNYSKMWFDLNEIIARSQQIWIPNTMPVIERWFWLNSNIYRDGDSVKAQYYMFTPTAFYQYNDAAGSLDPVLWYGIPEHDYTTAGSQLEVYHTWAQYLTIVNNLISALLNSQDRGIIFGDILKAYGADKLYSISAVGADYTVEPVYDREVLTQIENAVMMPVIPSVIQQQNGNIIQKFRTQLDGDRLSMNGLLNWAAPNTQVLNFHQKEIPTPEQIMVATRLKPINQVMTTKIDSTTDGVVPEYSGTEIVNTIGYLYYSFPNNVKTLNARPYHQYLFTYTSPGSSGTEHSNQTVATLFDTIWAETAFDWSPWVYRLAVYDSNPSAAANGTVWQNGTNYAVGDYDNYTYLTASELSKMHTTAIYSEFGVPSGI